MSKHKKISLWVIKGAAAFLVLLLAFLLLLPKLINLEPIRERILADLSEKVGCEIRYQRANLSFLPRPHMVIYQGSLSISENISGIINSLTVYPEILPLLTGKLRITSILVEGPDFKVRLPKTSLKDQKRQKTISLKAVEEKMAPFLAPLAMDVPSPIVSVEGGKLELSEGNQMSFSFRDIQADIKFRPDKLKIDITCKSNICDNISFKGWLDPAASPQISLELEGREVDVSSIREAALTLAGDVPVTKDIFDIVKGGKVPLITVNAKGNTIADLGKTENIVIKGSMVNGEIFIPGPDLDLDDVNGDAVISKGILEGKNLEAGLGNSRGHEGRLKLGLEGENAPFNLDILVDADLAQLPPVLKRLIKTRSFAKEIGLIKDLKGKATGRLVLGESTAVSKTSVNVSEFHVSANYQRIPFPLEINGRHFSYEGTGINVENVSGKLGKSSLSKLSGRINWKEQPYLEVESGKADISLDAIRWLSKLIHMPPELNLRSPFSISQSKLVWEKGVKTAFKGNLVVQNGPNISMDIYQNPEELVIKDLLIRDEKSHASFSFNLKNREIGLGFSGQLAKKTVNEVFAGEYFIAGWITGDFKAQILMDQPLKSSARGSLAAKNIMLPLKRMAPVKIESISLNAIDDKIHVEPTIINWENNHITLGGDVSFSEKGFMIDMGLSTNDLTWDNIKKALDKKDGGKGDGVHGKRSWGLPVKGTLRLNLKKFKYGKFIWSPLRASISLKPEGFDVEVTEANLCGISTPGVLKITSSNLSLDFKPTAKNQELNSTALCLSDKELQVMGNFDLKGEVKAQGMGKELISSLHGGFEFTAKGGRIYRYRLLSRILDFLNVTEIFAGHLPNLEKEGLGYNSLLITAKLQNGKLMLKKTILDGPTMTITGHGDIDLLDKKMDLTLLVAPLKAIDRIVGKIPLIKYITQGTLVSIPVRVKGDLEDPKIIPISPSAVGSELLGIMERTLTLPVHVIQLVRQRGRS